MVCIYTNKELDAIFCVCLQAGVENLAKALRETPKFGGEESQQVGNFIAALGEWVCLQI